MNSGKAMKGRGGANGGTMRWVEDEWGGKQKGKEQAGYKESWSEKKEETNKSSFLIQMTFYKHTIFFFFCFFLPVSFYCYYLLLLLYFFLPCGLLLSLFIIFFFETGREKGEGRGGKRWKDTRFHISILLISKAFYLDSNLSLLYGSSQECLITTANTLF